MVYSAYVAIAADLVALGGVGSFYYFLEICNSIRIDHLMKEEGKKWNEIKYKTPFSKFLVDKKSL